MKYHPLLAATFVLGLASCAFGPIYKKPETTLPSTIRDGGSGAESSGDKLWKDMFPDAALRGLIDEALVNNRDLVAATYRIEEAAAAADAARSQFFPTLDGQGSATRGRSSQENGPIPPGFNPYFNSFNLGALLSYEVDLWGRVRKSNESARARLLASEYARATVQSILVASVAAAYIDLRAADRQLEIARTTLASRKESLEIVRKRVQEGVSSDLESGQAEVLLHQAEVAVPTAERAIRLKENEISLLLGRMPGGVQRGQSLEALAGRMRVSAGLPTALLERRPDVLAAEQNLIAQNADIGVAKAAYFPALRLTGQGGLLSNDVDQLFESTARTWAFTPSLAGPIFDGGRIRANVKATEARQKQSLAKYEKSIQLAFRESADALISYAKAGEIVGRQRDLVGSLQKVTDLASARYEGGASSFLEVLDAERNLFDGELALTDTLRLRSLSVVDAYRALGGGWKP
jgi:multidrug efflux system outer membrane protein